MRNMMNTTINGEAVSWSMLSAMALKTHYRGEYIVLLGGVVLTHGATSGILHTSNSVEGCNNIELR